MDTPSSKILSNIKALGRGKGGAIWFLSIHSHKLPHCLVATALSDDSWDPVESCCSMPARDKVIFLLLLFQIWNIGIFYEVSFCPILDTHPIAISLLESWDLTTLLPRIRIQAFVFVICVLLSFHFHCLLLRAISRLWETPQSPHHSLPLWINLIQHTSTP